MRDDRDSIADLLHELDKTKEVIDILERASQELRLIIDSDEAVRQNPLRRRQLLSIGEHLAIARVKKTSLTLMIERLQARVIMGRSLPRNEGAHRKLLALAGHGR